MPKRPSYAAFDRVVGQPLSRNPNGEFAPSRSRRTTKAEERNAVATSQRRELAPLIPEDNEEEKDKKEEISGIRRRIYKKESAPALKIENKPGVGASAILAIEHAKSTLADATMTERTTHQTRIELVNAKRNLEQAVSLARAQRSEETANEYFGYIQEIEHLLERIPQSAEELEEHQTINGLRQNLSKNHLKLKEYAAEKRRAVEEQVDPLNKEIKAAKAALKSALLENSIMDEEAELRRIDETLKQGGFGAFKLRAGDWLRGLSGSPSILDLRKKVESLELQKDLLRGEAQEFAIMGRASEGNATTQSRNIPRRPKASSMELRRDTDRREKRIAQDLEKEYLNEETDGSIEVDLSELKKEEPTKLVKVTSRKEAANDELPTEDVDLSDLEENVKFTPIELDFEELEQAIEKQKKAPIYRRARSIEPPAKLQVEAREAETRIEMNVKKASELVPNAETLWYKANEQLTEKNRDSISDLEFGTDVPQTKFVFLVARYLEAKKDGVNGAELRKLRQTAEKAAAILKLNKDAAFLEAMGQ